MGRRERRSRDDPGFVHRFEGPEVLAELLGIAGSPLEPEEVLRRFRAGRAGGAEAGEVVPTLFPEAPRFPSPDVARSSGSRPDRSRPGGHTRRRW